MSIIYFDNAATTFPKPPPVIREAIRCMKEYCGNPGRSSHALSLASAKKIYECRCEAASLFHSGKPENVVFTYNTTYALNIVLKSVLRTGEHVIISNAEHNSVLRPVYALKSLGVTHDVFNAFEPDKAVLLREIKSLVRNNTRVVAVTHASNICGLTLPIYEIGKLCRKLGILFIVDAAQSAGTHDIDIEKNGIFALCVPSHKGLYGPQGGGLAVFADNYSKMLSGSLGTLIEGGSGVNSLLSEMPPMLPERLEAGTLATPVIAGLAEGIKTVRNMTPEAILHRENLLYNRLRTMLKNTGGVSVYHGDCPDGGTLLFNVDGVPAERTAVKLNEADICVRSGFHCAPLAHKALNTGENGAVRVSFGMYNKLSELERFYKALRA